MISGFFTFVIWLILMVPAMTYCDDKSYKLTKKKIYFVIYANVIGCFLIWAYINYWTQLCMVLGVIYIIAFLAASTPKN